VYYASHISGNEAVHTLYRRAQDLQHQQKMLIWSTLKCYIKFAKEFKSQRSVTQWTGEVSG